MFESSQLPKSLDEHIFNTWLEEGRESRMSYLYLLIIWDAMDEKYCPVYVDNRDAISSFETVANAKGREQLVAAYDLYSESRIT